MTIVKNSGRQEPLTGYIDIDFSELTTAGEFEVMQLPTGAMLIAGGIVSGLTGVTDYTLTVDDKDGTEIVADVAGTYGAGYVAIAPNGTVTTVPGFVKLTTTGNASAGSVRVYLCYIVDGRACVSEG